MRQWQSVRACVVKATTLMRASQDLTIAPATIPATAPPRLRDQHDSPPDPTVTDSAPTAFRRQSYLTAHRPSGWEEDSGPGHCHLRPHLQEHGRYMHSARPCMKTFVDVCVGAKSCRQAGRQAGRPIRTAVVTIAQQTVAVVLPGCAASACHTRISVEHCWLVSWPSIID
jgi:hypothetical protein